MLTKREQQIINRIDTDTRIKAIRFGGMFIADDLPTAIILDDDHHIHGMHTFPVVDGWEGVAKAIAEIEVIY